MVGQMLYVVGGRDPESSHQRDKDYADVLDIEGGAWETVPLDALPYAVPVSRGELLCEFREWPSQSWVSATCKKSCKTHA